ncbi:MAG: hypothetical protein RLZZ546_2996, partial [Bacteroidota bacterium]
ANLSDVELNQLENILSKININLQ